MSSSDRIFFQEVTEELRRDRLFSAMRRYGWIAAVLVILIVAGAAFNEWRKSNLQTSAEALGAQISMALAEPDLDAQASAMEMLRSESDGANLIAGLYQAAAEQENAQESLALSTLDSLPVLPDQILWNEMAAFKALLISLPSLEPDNARMELEEYIVLETPFVSLAEEHLAYLELAEGEAEAAISRLRALLAQERLPSSQRARLEQFVNAFANEASAS